MKILERVLAVLLPIAVVINLLVGLAGLASGEWERAAWSFAFGSMPLVSDIWATALAAKYAKNGGAR